ncbi:hypothetical protein, partial [Faecalispora jeddahensis]|uniref:hypothetical protein n=1 Tax=Faecalispora jeddahensis TaxID=1414721 RepID=UPI0028A915C2
RLVAKVSARPGMRGRLAQAVISHKTTCEKTCTFKAKTKKKSPRKTKKRSKRQKRLFAVIIPQSRHFRLHFFRPTDKMEAKNRTLPAANRRKVLFFFQKSFILF